MKNENAQRFSIGTPMPAEPPPMPQGIPVQAEASSTKDSASPALKRRRENADAVTDGIMADASIVDDAKPLDTGMETNGPIEDNSASHDDNKINDDTEAEVSIIDVAGTGHPSTVVSDVAAVGLDVDSTLCLDLTVKDKDGRPWDFRCLEMQRRAMKRVIDQKPKVVIGSIMCYKLSAMVLAKWEGMTERERRAQIQEIEKHIKFMCAIYLLQHRAGRYFVHEHPMWAASWAEHSLLKVQQVAGAQRLRVDQCQYGLELQGEDGVLRPNKKPTVFITQCPAMATTLNRTCNKNHVHTQLKGSMNMRQPQGYPEGLVRAMLTGIKLQKEWDERGQFFIGNVHTNDIDGDNTEPIPPEEEHDQDCAVQEAMDDVTGYSLDPAKVREARREEIRYYKQMGVYTKVPIKECYDKTGQGPIGVRWVDVDKGKGNPEMQKYRSRLVAQQFNTGPDNTLFAATPPIEALKMVLSMATTGKGEKQVMINDVSRAYMYAPVKEAMYVQLCDEDREPGEDHLCGRLNKAMYGTRAAAQYWQMEFTDVLITAGFCAGKSSPCIFSHQSRGIYTFVHGDDFVSTGPPEDLKWLKQILETRYKISTLVLGESRACVKKATILNRIIHWHDGIGISLEGDPRHVQIMIEEMNCFNKKPLKIPAAKSATTDTDEIKEKDLQTRRAKGVLGNKDNMVDGDVLTGAALTTYRSVVARGNYLSTDRPDISYSVKECARRMSCPTADDWVKLERLVLYLKGKPVLRQWFAYQKQPGAIRAYTDTDWAGCVRTRRSTTGGAIRYGSHTLKCWSRTQAVIALSSGEAELYGAVKASSEALGFISMFKDFGVLVKGEVYGDANAALGIIGRKGFGKVRHLNTNFLWVQERAARRELLYGKIDGTYNVADLFTKPLDHVTLIRHTEGLNCEFIDDKTMPQGQTPEINYIGSRPLGNDVHRAIQNASLGGLALNAWTRTDMDSRTLRTTLRGGPPWSSVLLRITSDARSGEVLLVEKSADITRSLEHALVSGGPRDLQTTLVFDSPTTSSKTNAADVTTSDINTNHYNQLRPFTDTSR